MINEAAGSDLAKKSVLICDTQPVAVEGLKWLIENSGDLYFAGFVQSLDAAYAILDPEGAKAALEAAAQASLEEAARISLEAAARAVLEMEASGLESAEAGALDIVEPGLSDTQPSVLVGEVSGEELFPPALPIALSVASPVASEAEQQAFSVDLCALAEVLDPCGVAFADAVDAVPAITEPIDAVVIDKGLGLASVMELLQKLTSTFHPTPAVIWGASITEAEALRLLQAGARGIVRRTSESGTLLACLRAVTAGATWMEDGIFGATEKLFNPRRSQLTSREREVVVLVEKGLRNRDIARLLGIQTGTVKIHLKHIFEKTGVRGRYGLAFTELQSKGSIALTAPAQFTA